MKVHPSIFQHICQFRSSKFSLPDSVSYSRVICILPPIDLALPGAGPGQACSTSTKQLSRQLEAQSSEALQVFLNFGSFFHPKYVFYQIIFLDIAMSTYEMSWCLSLLYHYSISYCIYFYILRYTPLYTFCGLLNKVTFKRFQETSYQNSNIPCIGLRVTYLWYIFFLLSIHVFHEILLKFVQNQLCPLMIGPARDTPIARAEQRQSGRKEQVHYSYILYSENHRKQPINDRCIKFCDSGFYLIPLSYCRMHECYLPISRISVVLPSFRTLTMASQSIYSSSSNHQMAAF